LGHAARREGTCATKTPSSSWSMSTRNFTVGLQGQDGKGSIRALGPVQPNGSAFSGVAQPCAAARDAWDSAILPRGISAQRCHVRCNAFHEKASLVSPRSGSSLRRLGDVSFM
jgi:hypothetical protein